MTKEAGTSDIRLRGLATSEQGLMTDTTSSASVTPLVTIGLSVYNAGPQLLHAVQSILDQTWTNWELVILDDGSTDGMVDALRVLSDPRIHIVCDGENHGLAARLNQAVDMARGKYFARMDQDDICHPERFAHQITFLECHPDIDLLATECVTIDANDRLTGVFPSATDHADICRRPWLGFYMPHPTWMGKVAWFRHHRYLEPAPYFCEDQELLLRAHTMSVFHTLPEKLLAYRVRAQPVWRKLWRTRCTLCQIQLRYFISRGQWINALLSLAALILRMGLDVWHEIVRRLSQHHRPDRRPLMGSDLARQWEAQIEAVKASVERHPDAPENGRV